MLFFVLSFLSLAAVCAGGISYIKHAKESRKVLGFVPIALWGVGESMAAPGLHLTLQLAGGLIGVVLLILALEHKKAAAKKTPPQSAPAH